MLISENAWNSFVNGWWDRFGSENVSNWDLIPLAKTFFADEDWKDVGKFCASARQIPSRVHKVVYAAKKQVFHGKKVLYMGYEGGLPSYRLVEDQPVIARTEASDKELSAFVQSWHTTYADAPVSARELLPLASCVFDSVRVAWSEQGQKSRLSRIIAKCSGREINGFKVVSLGQGDSAGGVRNVAIFRLQEVKH